MYRRSIAVALPLLLLSCAAVAQPLAVKQWVRFPEYRNVVISPDGTYLAVVFSPKHSDTFRLAVVRTRQVLAGKPKVTAHWSLREYEQFAGIRWVNDKRLIAWTARQFGGFNRPYLDGNLLAVNADGAFKKQLLPDNAGWFGGLLSLLPDRRRAVLVDLVSPHSNKAWAYRIDVYTGATAKVAQSPAANGGMLADHNGDVRLAWGTNTRTGRPELFYRAAGKLDWKNESSVINGNKAAAAALETGGPIMFGPHDQSIYFQKWTDDARETMGLYRFDLETWKARLLYASKRVDVGIGDFPDTNPFIYSFDGKSIVGFRLMPGKVETRVLDARAPRIQLLAGLEQAFSGKDVEIVSHTRDGAKAVVKVWGDVTPPKYYLYSSKPKPSVVPLFAETPWIKPDDLSPVRPISYTSRDGLTIHGYLTVPRGKKAKDLPLVVYVHGGPHGIRYDWGFDPTDFDLLAAQILANHGYAVLAPNYRGSGGYGFKFEQAGFRHWGDTMQNDLADAVHWAVKQGIANPRRICILGASYGGYAALMSVERFPDLYRCAVGYDGVYDLPLLKTRASDVSRHASGRLYEDAVLGEDHKQLVAFSPAFHADRIKAAVFLLHGGRDQRAPVKGYDEMRKAIHKHGTPLKTLYERNEGHGFYKPAHRAKAWTEILAFLNEYIGPGATGGGGAN